MYKDQNHGFNFFAEFTNEELEEKYIASSSKRSRSYAKRCAAVGLTAVAFFFFVDWFHFSFAPNLWAFFIIRFAPLVCGIPAIIAADRIKSQKQFSLVISFIELLTFSSYLLILLIYKMDDVTFQCVYVAVFILIFFQVPNYGKSNLINSLIITAGYFITVFIIAEYYSPMLFSIQIIAVLVTLYFSFASYKEINLLKRRQFLREMQLRDMLNTDHLTNTMSRGCFDTLLAYYCHPIDLTSQGFSLILFDVDDLKHVNDTYGHDAGDHILVRVVEVVKAQIRKGDIIARYSGEEFMVLLPNATLGKAADIADKLRTQIVSTFADEYGVTASFGVTEFQKDDTIGQIVKRVDSLMYSAKAAGKNKVYVQ